MKQLLRDTKSAEKEEAKKQALKRQNYQLQKLTEEYHALIEKISGFDEPHKILMPNEDGTRHESYDQVIEEVGPRLPELMEELCKLKAECM